jgi:predicted RNase H-like HicB family nuclease
MSQAFAVVIEETEHNFSAYVPDLPGCVASGSSREHVLAEIRDAIAFHLEGLPLTSGCPDRSTWASTLPPWRPDYDIKMRER